jgi:hypothetical protein
MLLDGDLALHASVSRAPGSTRAFPEAWSGSIERRKSLLTAG